MSMRWYKTFLAVAHCGTFAGAADKIGLTQAAVSIQMTALEENLRIKLFNRSGRAVVLNTAGHELLPRAVELVALYDNMADGLDDRRLGGLLALGAIPPTFAKLLPDALVLMKDRYPGIVVHVSTGISSELVRKVEQGELDAALVAEPPFKVAENLTWQAIMPEPLVLLTPKGHTVTTLRQTLSELPFIGISKTSWTGRLIYNTLRDHRIKVSASMELDSLDTITAMVMRGFGVSILPLSPSQWALAPHVNVTLLKNPQVVRRIGIVHRQRPNHESLIGALQTCLLSLLHDATPEIASVSLSGSEG